MWLLNREPHRLLKFLRGKVAIRELTITYLDEFNVAKPSMSFAATNYPQHNLAICIHCPQGHHLPGLQARRIKQNGVIDVPFRSQQNDTHTLRIDALQNEILRITWTRAEQNNQDQV
jgi:hypothetical protein